MQVAHLERVRGERRLFQTWERDASRDATVLMQYDDKLGSHWAFWPMWPGMRATKEARCAMRHPSQHHTHLPCAADFQKIQVPMHVSI